MRYAPPAVRPNWTPARHSMGQPIEKELLNTDNGNVSDFLTYQGVAIGYAVLASAVYGKHRILDRILLGLGAVAFGAASVSGFILGLDYQPSKHTGDYIVGNVAGALDAFIAIGAVMAAVNPKLVATSAPEAVKRAIPV